LYFILLKGEMHQNPVFLSYFILTYQNIIVHAASAFFLVIEIFRFQLSTLKRFRISLSVMF
jgi:hypothetical protein